MNNKDWINQFEEQNGRKPTPEELSLYLSADRNKSIKKQSFLEKIKKFVSTNRKKSVGIFIVLLLVLFSLGGYIYFQSQPKSVFNVLTVEFSGYDGDGELKESNETEFQSWMEQIILEKAGVDKDQAKLFATDPDGQKKIESDPRYASKMPLIKSMFESVHIDIDKQSGLKNGEEVTITVTVTNPNVPIKSEKKTFKVENLKEYEKVSAEDLIKEANIQFTGVDGYGKLVDKTNSVLEYTGIDKPQNLKNGDKLTFKVKDSYLKELKSKGKTFEENVVEVTVSGLKSKEEIKGTEKDYQPVLDEYLKTIKAGKYIQGSKFVNGEILSSNGKPRVLYYSLYDFDHNGVNELVIASEVGTTNENSVSTNDTKLEWKREIFNIFTLEGDKIVNNFPGIGYRMHVYPMTDGSFWEYGSGSAFLHIISQYKFTLDGTRIVEVLSLTFDSEDPVTHKMKDTPNIKDKQGKEYTKESFQNLLNQYTVLDEDKLSWKKFE
jgi:hypothetical protein